jgi:beta-fructofuranosidase
MLRIDDKWLWDSWIADDGDRFHLFFLQAPRAIPTPDHRHFNVSIGHAVSDDLFTWEILPDALHPAEGARWDDYTTWTGSVVRRPDGGWMMFYTGTSRADNGLVQRIGAAVSEDLITWERLDAPVLEADPRWYEKLEDGTWHDEAWRDPWVYQDPDGDGWHMLITARAKEGPVDRRGVVGHARSANLLAWEVQPPLSGIADLGHTEVMQVVEVDGRAVLLFCCGENLTPADRLASAGGAGMWSIAGDSMTGPFDPAAARPFAHPSLYAAHLIQDRSGQWNILGFSDMADGEFMGEITDPIPVDLVGDHIEPARPRADHPSTPPSNQSTRVPRALEGLPHHP